MSLTFSGQRFRLSQGLHKWALPLGIWNHSTRRDLHGRPSVSGALSCHRLASIQHPSNRCVDCLITVKVTRYSFFHPALVEPPSSFLERNTAAVGFLWRGHRHFGVICDGCHERDFQGTRVRAPGWAGGRPESGFRVFLWSKVFPPPVFTHTVVIQIYDDRLYMSFRWFLLSQ